MAENQERFYKITTLNFLFAMAALTLLSALIMMVNNDYARGWKKYQKDFRDLEVEKTRVKYDLESTKLKEEPKYKELSSKVDDLTKTLVQKAAEIHNLEQESSRLQSQYDIVNQQSQFAKAKYDAKRYQYEQTSGHRKPPVQELKKELSDLDKKIQDARVLQEKYQAKQSDIQSKITGFNGELKSLQKELKSLTKQSDLYLRKLKNIDGQEMSFANLLGNFVRDLPVIELSNPNYRVHQVVLQDITDSVIFANVPKVDRCMTCHLGIANPDYKDAPQPFTTHPNLDLYLANNSPHPVEEFGCTTCHQGRGRGTSFFSAAHTPSSEEQKGEWEKKYTWHADHNWERPMFPANLVEASCLKCHGGQTAIKGAEKLNLGLNLIERAGCYSCHSIDRYKRWPKTGPDLTKIASKTSKGWSYRWLSDPHSFRHNTWMPSFFNESNNTDPSARARAQQEIHSIVHYLFAKSVPFNLESTPKLADEKKGEELISSLGCFGCHTMEKDRQSLPSTRQSLLKEQGPNLIGMGSKTSKEWIYNWLKNPNHYHPDTKMPNLRLSDEEAADIAEYLGSLLDRDFMSTSIPKVDNQILDQINAEFLKKSTSIVETESRLVQMDDNDKLLYAGEKLIRFYGCFACHNISGFEKDKPIGTELTEEGDKDPARLDFGLMHMAHTKQAWFFQKLKDPRIYDHGLIKEPTDKLRMPNFHFTDDEAQAITTALLGFVKDRPNPGKMDPQNPQQLAINDGRKLVRQLNCLGCHRIENEGGAIESSITDWLVKFKGRAEDDAKAVTVSFSPPNLIGEGKKVQTEWLFNFFHNPEAIRPWLSVRMPTYHLDVSQLNTLLKYFSALDEQEFPFSETALNPMSKEDYEAAQKLFSMDYFGCAKCHIVGNKMPEGSPESWAPNFALAKRRLKPNWIIEWLHNPQALLPGTKMPTYFDAQNFDISGPDDILNGDEKAQIKVLSDYLMTLADSPAAEPGQSAMPSAGASIEGASLESTENNATSNSSNPQTPTPVQ